MKTEIHGQCKLYLGGTAKKTAEINEDHSNENKQMLFIQSSLLQESRRHHLSLAEAQMHVE